MNKTQKKIARIIFRKGISIEEAQRINSADGWFPNKNDIIRLSEDQLEEAHAWAVKRSKENRKFDKMQYLIAMILSFLMALSPFQGFWSQDLSLHGLAFLGLEESLLY